jgi:hypothetical protein
MRATTSLLAALTIAGGAASAADVLTKKLSDEFAAKVVIVQNHANGGSKKPLATTFTEAETNSYLKFGAADLLPTGLTQPNITMLGEGRVTGNAVVDLDIVRRKQSSGGWLDPTSYLTGKLPVMATGRIITGDGKARIELERAEISGLPLPKSFLAQMVNFFTRTADNPKGSSIDDTFELPANIIRIDVQKNRFVTHQ